MAQIFECAGISVLPSGSSWCCDFIARKILNSCSIPSESQILAKVACALKSSARGRGPAE